MPNTKLGGNRWVPDIRADKIKKFTDGDTEYKAVDSHPILNKILDAKAFFTTHASAVWYSVKDNKSVKDKLDEIDNTIEALRTPQMHRVMFRGKNLGSSLTQAQKDAIKNQTFKDLYVGDYWSIGGRTWRIVDINYWMGKGDTSCTTPHVVVMPDQNLYSQAMNASNTTEGAYLNSVMYKTGLEQAKSIVSSAFGTNVLNHRILLSNTTANGIQTNGAWTSSTVDLPNEIMMYGSYVFASIGNGTSVPYIYTCDTTQLALMQICPYYIQPSRSWFWLRDVVSSATFADVDYYGNANYTGASNANGVRPVVGITG